MNKLLVLLYFALIISYSCSKDCQENEKVPPGVENDDTVDRFLVNVMNGVLSESSSLHGFNRFEAQ